VIEALLAPILIVYTKDVEYITIGSYLQRLALNICQQLGAAAWFYSLENARLLIYTLIT
jgi:hypothetical protein